MRIKKLVLILRIHIQINQIQDIIDCLMTQSIPLIWINV